MRRAIISVCAVLLLSLVLGVTVFRAQVARAGNVIENVFVTNDSTHPVPVREQNLDANGNIKVHEQGTANVNVTNSSLPVSAPAVTGGGGGASLEGGLAQFFSPPATATALAIHMTAGVADVRFLFGTSLVAIFNGPGHLGNDNVVLALTRPIEFDDIVCDGGSLTDQCTVSFVGAQP